MLATVLIGGTVLGFGLGKVQVKKRKNNQDQTIAALAKCKVKTCLETSLAPIKRTSFQKISIAAATALGLGAIGAGAGVIAGATLTGVALKVCFCFSLCIGVKIGDTEWVTTMLAGAVDHFKKLVSRVVYEDTKDALLNEAWKGAGLVLNITRQLDAMNKHFVEIAKGRETLELLEITKKIIKENEQIKKSKEKLEKEIEDLKKEITNENDPQCALTKERINFLKAYVKRIDELSELVACFLDMINEWKIFVEEKTYISVSGYIAAGLKDQGSSLEFFKKELGKLKTKNATEQEQAINCKVHELSFLKKATGRDKGIYDFTQDKRFITALKHQAFNNANSGLSSELTNIAKKVKAAWEENKKQIDQAIKRGKEEASFEKILDFDFSGLKKEIKDMENLLKNKTQTSDQIWTKINENLAKPALLVAKAAKCVVGALEALIVESIWALPNAIDAISAKLEKDFKKLDDGMQALTKNAVSNDITKTRNQLKEFDAWLKKANNIKDVYENKYQELLQTSNSALTRNQLDNCANIQQSIKNLQEKIEIINAKIEAAEAASQLLAWKTTVLSQLNQTAQKMNFSMLEQAWVSYKKLRSQNKSQVKSNKQLENKFFTKTEYQDLDNQLRDMSSVFNKVKQGKLCKSQTNNKDFNFVLDKLQQSNQLWTCFYNLLKTNQSDKSQVRKSTENIKDFLQKTSNETSDCLIRIDTHCQEMGSKNLVLIRARNAMIHAFISLAVLAQLDKAAINIGNTIKSANDWVKQSLDNIGNIQNRAEEIYENKHIENSEILSGAKKYAQSSRAKPAKIEFKRVTKLLIQARQKRDALAKQLIELEAKASIHVDVCANVLQTQNLNEHNEIRQGMLQKDNINKAKNQLKNLDNLIQSLQVQQASLQEKLGHLNQLGTVVRDLFIGLSSRVTALNKLSGCEQIAIEYAAYTNADESFKNFQLPLLTDKEIAQLSTQGQTAYRTLQAIHNKPNALNICSFFKKHETLAKKVRELIHQTEDLANQVACGTIIKSELDKKKIQLTKARNKVFAELDKMVKEQTFKEKFYLSLAQSQIIFLKAIVRVPLLCSKHITPQAKSAIIAGTVSGALAGTAVMLTAKIAGCTLGTATGIGAIVAAATFSCVALYAYYNDPLPRNLGKMVKQVKNLYRWELHSLSEDEQRQVIELAKKEGALPTNGKEKYIFLARFSNNKLNHKIIQIYLQDGKVKKHNLSYGSQNRLESSPLYYYNPTKKAFSPFSRITKKHPPRRPPHTVCAWYNLPKNGPKLSREALFENNPHFRGKTAKEIQVLTGKRYIDLQLKKGSKVQETLTVYLDDTHNVERDGRCLIPPTEVVESIPIVCTKDYDTIFVDVRDKLLDPDIWKQVYPPLEYSASLLDDQNNDQAV